MARKRVPTARGPWWAVLCVAACAWHALGSPLGDWVGTRGRETLDRLRESGDDASAASALGELFDQATSAAGRGTLDALSEAYFYDRFVHDLATLPAEDRQRALQAERTHPEPVHELVFALDRGRDDVREAWTLFLRLVDERGKAVASLPGLAAAIAVVHDEPLVHTLNENTATAGDPVAIFDYFAANRRRLAIEPDALPVELLVFVVDTTAPPEDMAWALKRHGRRPDVGSAFFQIDYDTDSLRGKPKKVTQAGRYSLPAIAQHGGVCADQAYYAASVGKSCGIPTAYIVGRSNTVGHAWVGYVERRGRRTMWNLESGRYDDYQNLRGRIEHPQTRVAVDDSHLAMLAGIAAARPAERRAARATAYAVRRWSEHPPEQSVEPPQLGRVTAEGRSASVDDRLELLRLGMQACPARLELWDELRRLAGRDELSMRQMDAWARSLQAMCGREYPDFAAGVLRELIRSVDDVGTRSKMLDWAYGRFRDRADLAAEIRFEQATLWREAGDLANAWAGYVFIIDEFPNDGQAILGAVDAAARMLYEQDKHAEIMPLFERALTKVERPATTAWAAAFAAQNNYARLRAMQDAWRRRLTDGG